MQTNIIMNQQDLKECIAEVKNSDIPNPSKKKIMNMLYGRMYKDGWIPCSEKMPEDGVDVLVWYEYFRYGEYNRLFQTTGISYTYNGKWSGFVNGQSGWNQLSVIAWQPLPETYTQK